MSLSAAAFRPNRSTPWLRSAANQERSARRRVCWSWGLLVFNTLTFYKTTWSGAPLAIPIPSVVGKSVQQGAVFVALLLALSVNRRLVIRPNVFLFLISLLVAEAFMTVGEDDHIGTFYRVLRFAVYLITLWLLTPWWGRRDLLLVRAHLIAASVVLGSVVLGLLVAPKTAHADGRLGGALWPTPPTQVADIATVTIGLVVVMWLGGMYSGRLAFVVTLGAGAILLLTHTRTALVGLVGAVLVAALSLFNTRARVRKLFASASVILSVGLITVSGVVTAWLARGQDAQELSDLTGRTTVWTGVLSMPRDKFETLFGFGLSNDSFNGLPIDSNWIACYMDQGLIGVIVSAAVIVYLLVAALFQPRRLPRALALFLITYDLAASFTQVGFSGVSTYLLYAVLAASLLVRPSDDLNLVEE